MPIQFKLDEIIPKIDQIKNVKKYLQACYKSLMSKLGFVNYPPPKGSGFLCHNYL